MGKVAFLYSDIFLRHRSPHWHPENPDRLRAILKGLKEQSLWQRLTVLEPPGAEYAQIEAVHEREYVHRIRNASPGYLDPDTYFSDGSLEAAMHAAGAVVEAVRLCAEEGYQAAFAAVRPPGHHATPNRAMGFCIFNNIAVGAREAQRRGYERVFIVDFDVHHGNGTEEIFYRDNTVYYFSTHQYPHYPGTGRREDRGEGPGEGFTYNVPLSAGSGDREYSEVYTDVLPELVRDFKPHMIMVSAGYDLRLEDPLSAMNVTAEGMKTIVRGILRAAENRPVIFALEGGYNLNSLSESVCITIEEMINWTEA